MAVRDELKKREIVVNESFTETGDIAEGIGRTKWQEELDWKEDPFLEKSITNDAIVECVRRPEVKGGPFEATERRPSIHEKAYSVKEMSREECFRLTGDGGILENTRSIKGIFYGKAPQLRLQHRTMFEALDQSDSMDDVAAASRQESSYSPSGSESSSSLSSLESASFSCKSGTSPAKGELSPFRAVPAFVRSTHKVVGSVSQSLFALPLLQEANTCDAKQKLDMKYHPSEHEPLLPLSGDDLELKFLKGRLVEKLGSERGAMGTKSVGENQLSRFHCLGHRDSQNATSPGIEVEMDDVLQSLSALPFQERNSCDARQKLDMTYHMPSLDKQLPFLGDNQKLKSLKGRMVERRVPEREPATAISAEESGLSSLCVLGHGDRKNAMPLGTDVEIGTALLPGGNECGLADVELSDEECSLGLTTPAFYSATACSPESFSEASQSADGVYKWEFSVFNEDATVQSSDVEESECSVDNQNANFFDVKPSLGADAETAISSELVEDEDRMSLLPSACPRRDLLVRNTTHNWQDICVLDVELSPNHSFNSNESVFTDTPIHQSPIRSAGSACPIPLSGERAKVDFTKQTGAETFKLKEAAALQLDWRTKHRRAMNSSSSAVRALESAFTTSRSASLPQKGSSAVQVGSIVDMPKLKERGSINYTNLYGSFHGSRESGHAAACNFSQQERASYGCPLQPSGKARNEKSLRRGARSSISVKRCVKLAPHSASPYGPGNLNTRMTQSFKYKHNSSELELLWKAFLPISKTIRCLPATAGVLNPGRSPVPALSKHLISSSEAASPFTRLRGDLECIWEDEFLTYTLSLDNSDDLLVARACKLGYCTGKVGCNLVYSFYAVRTKGKARWRTWGRKDKPAPVLTGKMRVLNVLHCEDMPSGETKHSVELQFVLFDGTAAQVAAQYESLRLSSLGTTADPLSSLSIITPSLASLKGNMSSVLTSTVPRAPLHRQCPSERMIQEGRKMENVCCQLQMDNPVKTKLGNRPNVSQVVWSGVDRTDAGVRSLSMCPPIMELAAIVITVPPLGEHEQASSKVNNETSGWGLKFLKKSLEATHKAGISCATTREDECAQRGQTNVNNGPYYWNKNKQAVQFACEEGCTTKEFPSVSQKVEEGHDAEPMHSSDTGVNNKGKQDQQTKKQGQANVSVILPAGIHSLPTVDSSGPSPLIERWRSGGSCDCGGWDLDCGLNILSTDRPSVNNTTESLESIEMNTVGTLGPNNPLQLFLQGSMQDAVVLDLAAVRDGLFVLNFQTQLTSLQAFAIAVAILHGKEPRPFVGVG